MAADQTTSWLTPNRRQVLAGIGAGLGGGLAGCLGGDGTTTDGDGGPKKVVVGIGNGGWDLIPGRDTDFDSNKVYTLIYDNVVNLNSDAEVVPELAKDWTRESDTQFVFELEEGVTFHDGTEFTAEDVKYTYEWFHEYENPRKSYISPVDEVVVEDDYTARLELSEPYGPLLYKIHAVMWPLSKEAVEKHGEDYNQNPVGTGPFQLTEWESGNYALLEKFDDYWKDDLPNVDEIEFRILPDSSSKVTQLVSGPVDVIDRSPAQHASKIENSSDHSLLTTTGVSVGRVDFNTDVEPLGNRKVRRALAWAVDKQQIVDTVLMDYGEPAKSILPSSFPDYNDDVSDYNHPTGDPDQAQSLLEEAGHANLSVELLVPTRERHEQTATLLQSMFDEIGVDATINTMEGNAMFSAEIEGNFEIAISNFTWFGDPDTLVYLFHSEGLNLWNIADSELESLLEDQRSTVDQKQRSQLLADIQKHIYEEAYSVFTYYPDRIQGIAKAIENFEQYPNGSFRSLKDAQVNQ